MSVRTLTDEERDRLAGILDHQENAIGGEPTSRPDPEMQQAPPSNSGGASFLD